MRWSSPYWRSSQLEYLRIRGKYLRGSLSVRSRATPGFLILRNVPRITFVRTARVRFTCVPPDCTSITLLSSATGRPRNAFPETDGRKLNRIHPMKRIRKMITIQLVALAHVQFRILWMKRYIYRTEVTALSSANAATALRSFLTAQPDCISTRACPSVIGHG